MPASHRSAQSGSSNCQLLFLLLLCLLLPTESFSEQQNGLSDNPLPEDGKFHDYEGKKVKFGGSGPRFPIHSGTKWCGAGNIARNFSDLGSAFETDKCCRQHDYCGVYVRPSEVKYNFKNTFLFTLSHCECDNSFLKCLQASKDAQAKSVLYYFFYSLRMPCFGLLPRPVCVKRTWWDKLVGGCSKYEDQEAAVLMRLPQINLNAPPPPLKFRTNRK
ncbi:hypothetical protein BOX15_Mlig003516g3 [Macrostomum lignano]|uniref:PA2c domain-containing protein n=2 Tax=Macrostomum lignano TaxID=282301 RepID=A0A1I8I151_9PLAT|nr:hypothetical protein BOX15_Mlig003516g1 [Macrostomum lignano]PAA80259.1 hypothetical protein BOX15_Mlig003516g3 [Macrostomum lignano]